MLTSILTPVVNGSGKRWRGQWARLAALHSLGSATSAALVGGALGSFAHFAGSSSAWRSSAYWAAVLVSILYLPRQMRWTSFPPLLQSTLQVPRRWAYDHPRWVTALLFGAGLGTGFYTRLVVPTFYLLIIWPFLAPGLLASVLIWGAYGLTRSCNVWWLALSAPKGDPVPHGGRLIGILMQRTDCMQRVNALIAAGVAVWLVAWRRLQ